MFEFDKRPRACVGDQVKITEPGQRYSTYTSFFERYCPGLLDGYDDGYVRPIKPGMLCTVIFCDYNHKATAGHDMYVIEPEANPGRYYLVNGYAFEICEMMEVPLIEIDEADMMSLFEVISCR